MTRGRAAARVARRAALGALAGVAEWLAAVPADASEPPPATANVHTSLVWIFGDDDMTHAPLETTPPSPGAGIGDRPGYDSLFEGLASRYTGRENRSELRLAGEAPGLFSRLTTRAGLALGLELSALGERASPLLVEDLGSFVEAEVALGRGELTRPDVLRVRLLPLNGDRQRVGELEALAWGGAVGPNWASPYATARGPVRAVRLELELGFARAHLGLKTATFLEAQPSGPAVEETSYGWYGGVASRWSAPLGVTLAFGHFEHGRLPGPAGSPRATTLGGSLALTLAAGLERPLPPVAFMNDGSPFDHGPTGEHAHGLAVSVEGAHLLERLWDFDHPGQSVLAPARAAAALAEFRAGVVDVRAALVIRDPAFVTRNGPGVFPSESLPHDASERPELGGAASIGFVLARAEPSLSVGVLSPAAVSSRAIDRAGQSVGTTMVVRGPGDIELLPPGEAPVPVIEVRPALEVRLSRLLEAVGFLDYRRDFNRTRLVPSDGGAVARGFRSADRLGYGVAARAIW